MVVEKISRRNWRPQVRIANSVSGLANESMNNEVVKKENNEAKKRMALPVGYTGMEESLEHTEVDDGVGKELKGGQAVVDIHSGNRSRRVTQHNPLISPLQVT